MEQNYLDLLREVMNFGDLKKNRTGIDTKSVFGRQLRFNLSTGQFPLLTTKKLNWKAIVGELLWFIEGSSDERRLCEITYGTRDPQRKTIWSPNAEHTTGAKYRPKFSGDLGRIYGVQWRHWQKFEYCEHPEAHEMSPSDWGQAWFPKEIDQLAEVVRLINEDPTSRRIIMSAYNVGELDEMALPPCHMFTQFNVSQPNRRLDCLVYIRSNDLFLGLPFNIASYALLTCMIAQATGCGLGELIITTGDAHIYSNHFKQVEEQLSRTPRGLPTLGLNSLVSRIYDFKMEDITIHGYNPYEPIKAEVAV